MSVVRISSSAWSPQQSPLGWAVINAVCFLASVTLLIDVFIAQADLSERPVARAAYLVWNFGTTLVWLVEVSLSVNLSRLRWEHYVEIFLAAYFTVDSFHLLYKWKIRKQDIDEELWDVLINVAVYAVASERVYSIYKRESQQQETQSTEATPLVV